MNCYLEVPVLANFMLIMLILGYIYIGRVFFTIIHYKFGVRIYRYLRRNLRYFKRYDQKLNGKFPIYGFSQYLESCKEENDDIIIEDKKEQEEDDINKTEEGCVCPICCDSFKLED